jgi:hypothetical protein
VPAAECERLLTFYGAGLHAYNGKRELWARYLMSVCRSERDCRTRTSGSR